MLENINESTRRANGQGSEYRLKDGRFGVAVSLGENPNGSRKRKSFTGKTQEIANNKMYVYLKKHGLLETTDEEVEDDTPKMIVSSYSLVEDFIKEFKLQGLLDDPDISSRTYENYAYSLKYFEDYFDGRTIGSITKNDIKRFFKYMEEARKKKNENEYAYSQTTLNRVLYIVKRMYARAYIEKYISVNPLDEIVKLKPKSRQEKTEVLALTEEEVEATFKILKQNKIVYPVIKLMLSTGMRPQEALGLRWKDIDFQDSMIRIRRALTVKVDFDEDGNKLGRKTVLSTTKRNSGDRDIKMKELAYSTLINWKNEAAEISKTAFGPDDYVFGNTTSNRWTYAGFRSSVKGYIQRNTKDVSELRLHRIRHTAATILAEDRSTIQEIAQMLGHKKLETTKKYIDRANQKIGDTASGKLDSGLIERYGNVI